MTYELKRGAAENPTAGTCFACRMAPQSRGIHCFTRAISCLQPNTGSSCSRRITREPLRAGSDFKRIEDMSTALQLTLCSERAVNRITLRCVRPWAAQTPTKKQRRTEAAVPSARAPSGHGTHKSCFMRSRCSKLYVQQDGHAPTIKPIFVDVLFSVALASFSRCLSPSAVQSFRYPPL